MAPSLKRTDQLLVCKFIESILSLGMGLYFLLRDPQLAPSSEGLWSVYLLRMNFTKGRDVPSEKKMCVTLQDKPQRPAETAAESKGNLKDYWSKKITSTN